MNQNKKDDKFDLQSKLYKATIEGASLDEDFSHNPMLYKYFR